MASRTMLGHVTRWTWLSLTSQKRGPCRSIWLSRLPSARKTDGQDLSWTVVLPTVAANGPFREAEGASLIVYPGTCGTGGVVATDSASVRNATLYHPYSDLKDFLYSMGLSGLYGNISVWKTLRLPCASKLLLGSIVLPFEEY
eukprot:6282450-Amphidinium_carterae.3